MRNSATGLDYANTDPSLHYNHSGPKTEADWRRVYNYLLKVYDYDSAELVKMRNMISDECDSGDHDLCFFSWCTCSHHSVNQFKLEHPGIRSLSEIESEREESEAA